MRDEEASSQGEVVMLRTETILSQQPGLFGNVHAWITQRMYDQLQILDTRVLIDILVPEEYGPIKAQTWINLARHFIEQGDIKHAIEALEILEMDCEL